MRTQSIDTAEWIEREMIQGHRRFSFPQRFFRVRSLTGSMCAMRPNGTLPRSEALLMHYDLPYLGDDAAAETPPFDIEPTLFAVTHLADSLGHPIALTGSLACCLYGFPRMVHDIDVLLTPMGAEALYRHLATSWMPLPPTSTTWSLIDPATLVKVDLMTTHGRIPIAPLIAQQHPICVTDGGEMIAVLTAEDVLLTRLAWYQEQGTHPDDQWNDLMGVVKIHAPLLDRSSLRIHAHTFDLDDILDQLLADCDEGDLAHVFPHGSTDHHSNPDTHLGSL
jgi:hypothetical protein